MLHWNVNPIFFSVGPVSVRWYGLLFAAGFLIGLVMIRWMFQREGRPLEDTDRLFNYMALGTIVGARLGHCLFYEPAYYLSHPIAILKIWEGGLASHGAFIGIIIAVWFYSRRRREQPLLWVLDRACVPTILAGSLIRLGNLFNSEIVGIPTDVPWAVVFERVDSLPRHPSQIYESMSYAAIFVLLWVLYRRWAGKMRDGRLFGVFLTAVFGVRFFIEITKTRQAAFGHDFPLSMGQILSIPLVALGLWLLFRKRGSPAP
ncbi:MAG: prolipoprotein diacylglyceryl transferase [Pseudomonadota bacterium]